MKFTSKSMKNDPVQVWNSEDGFYKIVKKPSTNYMVLQISLFSIMGETIGEYDSLEAAIEAMA